MDNEVQLATTQDLTKVSGRTYIAAGLCILYLVNVRLPLRYGVFIKM